MRRSRFGAVVALAALLVSLVAAPARAAAESWLRLVVHRPGVVRLDGEDWLDLSGRAGRAPVPWTQYSMQVLPVPAGAHRLELVAAGPGAVPPWETVVVDVAPGDTALVRLGRPLLRSSPAGARVLLDGAELGVTPLRPDPTRLPGRRLLLEMPGYLRTTLDGDSLLARAAASGGARVELVPLNPAPLPVLVTPDRASFIDRHRTLLLVGSTALLAGGVAAGLGFKSEADDVFDEYTRTGNPDRQRELFDRAERYDRLSLVGWALGEVGFVATFLLLIRQPPRALVPGADARPVGPDGHPGVTLRYTHEF